jgi:hypothetical protein
LINLRRAAARDQHPGLAGVWIETFEMGGRRLGGAIDDVGEFDETGHALHLHCSFAAEYHISTGVASMHWRGALDICLTAACRGESMTSAGLCPALFSFSFPDSQPRRFGPNEQEMTMTGRFLKAFTAVTFTATAAYVMSSPFALAQAAGDGRLKQAKLIIEHNATDNDTGFQAFVDADGWEKLEISGPKGLIAEFQGRDAVGELGMTELFMESHEPENVKMPIAELLAKMPAGDYEFRGTASKLGGQIGVMLGKALLTHKIPAGVTLIEPKKDAVIPVADLKIRWEGSGKALDGSDIKLISYQLIVEKNEEPDVNMIGKRGLSMHLPASVTEMTVPAALLEPGAEYKWEVLAIEESGNQTLTEGAFKTQ